uniref:Uncharacterized protein n=1 Tax=Quercus lobata TaxID=97700 RepID=A0A7N2LSM6_QUELO
MDQMKRAMEEMKDSMRRVNHVDDLVHMTDSPFVASIAVIHCLPSSKCPPWIRSEITLMPAVRVFLGSNITYDKFIT